MRSVAVAAVLAALLPAAGSAQQPSASVEQIAPDGSAHRVLLGDASWVSGPLDSIHVLRVVPDPSGATIESVSVLTGAVRTLARSGGPPHAVAVAGDTVAFGTCVPAESSCDRSAVWVAKAAALPAKVAEVEGSVRWIAWSPNRARLAVAATIWCRAGSPGGCNTNRLWLVAADGSSVTPVGYHGRAPAFSRDGRYLAYVGIREGGLRDRVWVDDLRSDTVRSVAVGRVALWSPTRDELAVGGPTVLLVRPDGTKRLVTRAALFYRSLWWAPDGRAIAFAAQGPRRNRLFVARLDPLRVRLLSTRVWDPPAAWSPDGRRLAYAVDEELFVAALEGSARRVGSETDPNVRFGPLWWSDDGSRIRYVATRIGS